MVDLPEPDKPVIHKTEGFWFKDSARCDFVTSVFCQCIFCDRLSAKFIKPAATVIFDDLSIRIKPPRSRLSWYDVSGISWAAVSITTPISFNAKFLVAICSFVSILILYFVNSD